METKVKVDLFELINKWGFDKSDTSTNAYAMLHELCQILKVPIEEGYIEGYID